jgi:hypothetical protein
VDAVPFELIDLETDRLVAGSRARVRGRLAGRTLEFDVEVLAADDERLKLVATGPVSIDVEYALRPAAGGSELRATVTVRGSGLTGRVLAQATDGFLAAGALDRAIGRIGRQLKARTRDRSPQTTVPQHRIPLRVSRVSKLIEHQGSRPDYEAAGYARRCSSRCGSGTGPRSVRRGQSR